MNKEYEQIMHNKALAHAMSSPNKKPTWYTEVEGGSWDNYPILIPFNYSVLKERDPKFITHEGLLIHSLTFGWPPAGQFVRWDCINGFTKPIPDKIWW